MKPHTKPIHRIIIHCTATPAGRRVTLHDVRSWHVVERGWDDVGYHYLVRLDGEVVAGRPVNFMGAHAVGHCRGEGSTDSR